MGVVSVGASPAQGRERRIRRVSDRHIAAGVLARVVGNWLNDHRPLRSQLWMNVWIELKRYGASSHIQNIELSRIRGIDRVRVEGPVRRHSPLVVAALSRLLECETFFQLGPDMGDTARLIAHNLPGARIFVLDEGVGAPDRPSGTADRVYDLSRRHRELSTEATGDTRGITQLAGDSATFDFVPYSGSADLVHIEGSQRPEQIRSDTEAAFGLLSELGTIVWDGYSGDASVYAYLNELAPSLDRPIYHILGTRLALYSRWDIVIPNV